METSDQIKNRLIRTGHTLTLGPAPEVQALRINVRHPDKGGVTRFLLWSDLDQAVDQGEILLRSSLEEMERILNRHSESA